MSTHMLVVIAFAPAVLLGIIVGVKTEILGRTYTNREQVWAIVYAFPIFTLLSLWMRWWTPSLLVHVTTLGNIVSGFVIMLFVFIVAACVAATVTSFGRGTKHT